MRRLLFTGAGPSQKLMLKNGHPDHVLVFTGREILFDQQALLLKADLLIDVNRCRVVHIHHQIDFVQVQNHEGVFNR